MSALHKALQRSESANNANRQSAFNPLASNTALNAKTNQRPATLSWALIALVLLGSVSAVIFWPSSNSPDTLSESNTTVLTERVNDDSDSAEFTEASATTVHEVLTEEALLEEASLKETSTETDIIPSNEPANQRQTMQTETAQASSINNASTTAANQNDSGAENSLLENQHLENSVTENSDVEEIFENNLASESAIEIAGIENQPETENLNRIDRSETETTASNPPTTNGIHSSITISGSTPANTATTNVTAQSVSHSQSSNVVTISSGIWQEKVAEAIENNDLELAEYELKAWIGASPTDETPRITLAKLFIQQQRFSEAEVILAQNNSTEALALTGIIYEKTERFQMAALTFERLFREQSNNGRWLLFWAINSERVGELDKSKTLYQNYLAMFRAYDVSLTQFAERRLAAMEG